MNPSPQDECGPNALYAVNSTTSNLKKRVITLSTISIDLVGYIYMYGLHNFHLIYPNITSHSHNVPSLELVKHEKMKNKE